MPSARLIITNDPYTYLKQGTEQSSVIGKRNPNDVFKVPKGAEFPLDGFSEVSDSNGTHYLCQFSVPLAGKPQWYVFAKHSLVQALDTGSSSTSVPIPTLSTPVEPPKLPRSLTLLDKIICCMKRHDFKIFTGDGEYNIVAIRGMRPSGTPCENKPNHFDDLLVVFLYQDGVPELVDIWVCTTEPGRHWTMNPMNPGGAARIETPGQYTAWQVGYHQGKANHLALVQTGGSVRVRRDRDKNYSPLGDRIDTGYFGVNIHHGWNAAYSNIGRTSAGCTVIPRIDLQQLFMKHIRKDKRYLANKNFVYTVTYLNGDDVYAS